MHNKLRDSFWSFEYNTKNQTSYLLSSWFGWDARLTLRGPCGTHLMVVIFFFFAKNESPYNAKWNMHMPITERAVVSQTLARARRPNPDWI